MRKISSVWELCKSILTDSDLTNRQAWIFLFILRQVCQNIFWEKIFILISSVWELCKNILTPSDLANRNHPRISTIQSLWSCLVLLFIEFPFTGWIIVVSVLVESHGGQFCQFFRFCRIVCGHQNSDASLAGIKIWFIDVSLWGWEGVCWQTLVCKWTWSVGRCLTSSQRTAAPEKHMCQIAKQCWVLKGQNHQWLVTGIFFYNMSQC